MEPSIVDRLVSQLLRSAGLFEFAVLAYCFMPDHVHILVEGVSDTADLRRFVADWKQRTAFDHGRRTHQRLWQVGFFGHVLRTEESAERHAQYIIGNPVRAGMAKGVGEYPFASMLPKPMEPEA